MHPEDNEMICPNCGSHVKGNYCYQCGQQNHLHKDTFWGLIFHFIEHYIHYDSKFWQSLKALWFSPGKLTIAYLNKQRMRYLPPISLYIFISFIYFFISASITEQAFSSNNGNGLVSIHDNAHSALHNVRTSLDSLDKASNDTATNFFSRYLDNKFEQIRKREGDSGKFIAEKINHTIPKIFFFMIPAMAAILKLLFIRRKNTYFVDHAIFSLHYHALWFSLFLIALIPMSTQVHGMLTGFLLLIAGIYFFVAMRRVYQVSVGRALLNTFVVAVCYTAITILAFVTDLFIVVSTA